MAKDVNDIIDACRKVANNLEKVDKNDPDAVNAALTSEKLAICCNACQAVSSFCVPDSTPNKCKGGCTVTSFAF